MKRTIHQGGIPVNRLEFLVLLQKGLNDLCFLIKLTPVYYKAANLLKRWSAIESFLKIPF